MVDLKKFSGEHLTIALHRGEVDDPPIRDWAERFYEDTGITIDVIDVKPQEYLCQLKLEILRLREVVSGLYRAGEDRQNDVFYRYENLLNRQFHAAKPNRKWVTDISYISLWFPATMRIWLICMPTGS